MKPDDAKLDELTAGCKTPEDLAKLYSQMLQRMLNRSLDAEMDAHLEQERDEAISPGARGNRRNGRGSKTLNGTFGEVAISPPRDRSATFDPH